MINITVKTLDSQNHQFTVDDSLTVEQFKNHIADKVNVPANRQRIIYCGRVLQDESKLIDYDVDGKVVHLVQRAPPNASTRNRRSLTPPPDLNRARGGFRGFDRVGNTVYMGMGSMSFPPGFMEAQQIIPPRATNTLTGTRLMTARRMLRHAENVIRQLENPSRDNESQPEEPAEEEMTPVIEARVIVPSNADQPIDGNALLSDIQNRLPQHENANSPLVLAARRGIRAAIEALGTGSTSADTPSGQASTSAPTRASTENSNAEANGENSRDSSSRLRGSRGTEMAALLARLNELQIRFAPFLARYQTFMQDDPAVQQEDLQETRQMMNRVSQVLHYLGHAYHSLSDVIIDVEQAPPRLLLCHPILIQQPALVQAGIPIQVEAQINLSADRPGSTTPSTTSTTSTGTSTNPSNAGAAQNTNATNTSSNTSSGGQPQPQASGPGVTLQSGSSPLGVPTYIGSLTAITNPMEIRSHLANQNNNRWWRRPGSENGQTQNQPSNATGQGQNSSERSASAPPESSETSDQSGQQSQNQGPPPMAGPGPFGANNGNLEFFMEVTPEALRGGNLIQSLIQLVGSQLGDTLNQAQNQRSEGAGAQSNQASNAQNQSQARSTQTNPTTSTHTRSTSRPHVHMTQQAVQGGFDPFLHCYSHHISNTRPRRAVPVNQQSNRQEQSASRESGAASNQQSAPSSAPPSGNRTGGTQPLRMEDVLREFQQSAPTNSQPSANRDNGGQLDVIRLEDVIRELQPGNFSIPNPFGDLETVQMLTNALTQTIRQHITSTPPAADGQNQSQNTSQSTQNQQSNLDFLSRLMMSENLPDILGNGPTLDVYMQSLHPEPYVQGESLVIDLIMLMLRNLRINDLFMISTGNMAPLQRQIDTIQDFFLNEVCQNDTSDAGIARAAEKIMNDFGPIISALQGIPARDNINMTRTIENFFRRRVPDIIRLAINSGSRSQGDSSQSASNLISTIWRAGRELLALALHCSANGQQGVETACEQVMNYTIFTQSNVPEDIHRWTVNSSRAALRTIFRNLDISLSEIEQYIVRNTSQAPPAQPAVETMNQQSRCEAARQNSVESMEVDPEPVVAPAPLRVEDTEPLPNVVWGSEPWHRQTPEEWVPIITRDIQRQRKQSTQSPFSDAYLSGMPSKKRKLINNSKPQGSLPQVISDGIRQAVTSTGLASAAPLDVVAQAASESTEIQTAYRSLLQTTVQSNLRNNEDFSSERYPNIARYFSESSTE